MASLSDIAKKHGVDTKAAEPVRKERFSKRRPWSLGDEESSEHDGCSPEQARNLGQS